MSLHKRPLFIFTITYIAGIICAVQAHMIRSAGFWICVCILLLGFSFIKGPFPRYALILGLLLFTVGFIRTSLYLRIPNNDVSLFANGRLVHVAGRIVSDPEPRGDRVRFILEASRIKTYAGEFPVRGRIMVTVYHTKYMPKPQQVPFFGHMVTIYGRLRHPFPPSNPGAVDYRSYLARLRVYSTLSTYYDNIAINKQNTGGLAVVIARFKDALMSKTTEMFPQVQGQLLLGILLGNYSLLPLDIQTVFMRSGTMHLFAPSGYNCVVIITILGWIVLQLTIPRFWRHLILIASVWVFTLLVGASPSIVRAAVMVTAHLSSYLFWRSTDLPNAVMLACLIVTGLNPLSLYHVDFQLSFVAVIAIILVMPLLEPMGESVLGSPKTRNVSRGAFLDRVIVLGAKSIGGAVFLSIAATLGTMPITAYYFNYFSLVSLIANAFIALLVLILTASSIAALLIGFLIPPLGHIAAVFPSWIAAVMLGVAGELGGQSWSSVSVSSPPLLIIVLYYAVLLGVLENAHKNILCLQKSYNLT
ncbi:MAG: ComEC family competence protein [Armatimonadetes bacterium]|nr:ComEC family competence protein [Armatimonadota bacterium]